MAEEQNQKIMPAYVEDHIDDPDLDKYYKEFCSGLDSKQNIVLNNLVWQVYKKEILVDDFVKKATELKLPQFREKILPGILRYDFYPIADYLNLDIANAGTYLSEKMLSEIVIIDLKDWINDFLNSMEITLSVQKKTNLSDILRSYLYGEISDVGIIDLVIESEEKNGVELSDIQANRLMEEFTAVVKDSVKTGVVISSQEFNLDLTGILPEVPAPLAPLVIQDFPVVAEEIIKKSGLIINPDLRTRFLSIIVSGLKEVRKIIEVRERLMADSKIGGVGLKLEDAENIINLISAEKKKRTNAVVVQAAPKFLENTTAPEVLLPAAPELKELASSQPPSPPQNLPIAETVEKKLDLVKPVIVTAAVKPAQSIQIEKPKVLAPTTSDIKPIQASTIKIVPQEKAAPKVELQEKPPVQPKTPVTNAIPQTPSGRAQVSDVVYRTRLIGPIEELSGMDLINFHRLSPKPKVAIDKIKSKIELLGGEGHSKKMQGVQAWQKSPLNQLYVAILNEGIKNIKPVKQIIEERKKNNLETLTSDEFQEIMEFNRSLHY